MQRILMVFDEMQTSKEELFLTAKVIVSEARDVEKLTMAMYNGINNKGISKVVVHAAIGIAGHLLMPMMPKPLGFLASLAVNAMRKNL